MLVAVLVCCILKNFFFLFFFGFLVLLPLSWTLSKYVIKSLTVRNSATGGKNKKQKLKISKILLLIQFLDFFFFSCSFFFF